jgi:hypothetical protein
MVERPSFLLILFFSLPFLSIPLLVAPRVVSNDDSASSNLQHCAVRVRIHLAQNYHTCAP